MNPADLELRRAKVPCAVNLIALLNKGLEVYDSLQPVLDDADESGVLTRGRVILGDMEEIQRLFCVSTNFQFIVSVAKNGFKKYMGKLSFNSERLRLALTRPVPDSFEVCQILGKTKASLLKLLNFLDDIAIKLRDLCQDGQPTRTVSGRARDKAHGNLRWRRRACCSTANPPGRFAWVVFVRKRVSLRKMHLKSVLETVLSHICVQYINRQRTEDNGRLLAAGCVRDNDGY